MSIITESNWHILIFLHDQHFALLQTQETDITNAPRWLTNDWQGLRDNVAPLQQALGELELELSGPKQVRVTLVVDKESSEELAQLFRDGTSLSATQWQIQHWETLFDGLGGSFDYPRPPLEEVLAASLNLLGKAASSPQKTPQTPIQNQVGAAPRLPTIPLFVVGQDISPEILLSFLPALYQHPFVHLSGADLANLIGKVEPFNLPSPYPQLSPETLAIKQQEFLRLPTDQQKCIVELGSRFSSHLQARPEMRKIINQLAIS